MTAAITLKFAIWTLAGIGVNAILRAWWKRRR
jgi:hypothetical protein